MKPRLSIIVAALCLSLSITGARTSAAQTTSPSDPDWLSRMLAAGWRQVQEGVLERRPGEERVEIFTYGKAGRRYMAQRLKERIKSLKEEHRLHPSAELGKVIAHLERDLREAEASSTTSQLDAVGGSEPTTSDPARATSELTYATAASSCGPDVGASATADPLPPEEAPGVTASADAHFSGCALGNAYAYAHVRATEGTVTSTRTMEDAQYDGSSLESAATASAHGSLDCFSEAYARAWDSSFDVNLEMLESNFDCPGPGPTDQVSFLGEPAAVPGTIWAADFDHGGEAVAYHDTTPGNERGSSYRTTDVDMYEQTVFFPQAGEWLEYTVDVETAGTYALVAQVSGADYLGGSFHVELDGVDVTGALAVPVTGSRSIWGAAVKSGVPFPAGRHVLRFVVDAAFDAFHSLRLVTAQVPFGGTVRTLPGTIEAGDFDEGGEQLSYHDTTAGCDGSCWYRTADVDRWDDLVWHTGPGEWLEYTVDVTASGTYTLAVRVGAEDGGATFHLEVDGVDVTGPLTVPTTGSWNTFQTVAKTGVALSAGRKILRLVIDDAAGALDAGTFDTITVQP